MAELNRSIFVGENEGERTIDVGEWVLEDGRLVRSMGECERGSF